MDDGAKGMRQSIRMLESAIHQGITHVICTPHANDHSNANANDLFNDRLAALNAEAAKLELPIEIGLGAEIMFGMNMQKVLTQPFGTLNGKGKYSLIEFPRQTPFDIIHNVVKAVVKWGYVPVIAHHERYPLAFRSIEQLIKLRTDGAILTMDAGSLTGQFGLPMKRHSRDLLSTGHIEILTSDAHDDDKQNFCLAAARDEAAAIVGLPTAKEMVTDAPRRIWNGEEWPQFKAV
ncbi:MAG: hypothetical protein IPP40_00815 [bacterium]|nr:hypothetical protein [bacterium]